MHKSYFDSGGKNHELIAVLTAMSQVSARMARNLELLSRQRNLTKGNTEYDKNKRFGNRRFQTAERCRAVN